MSIARVALALCLLVGRAHAETDPCVTTPRDPSTRAMTVRLVDALDWDYHILAASPGAEFPAVSADGKTIVHLFQDYRRLPFSRLEFWSTSGERLAQFTLEADRDRCGTDRDGAATARERATAKAANARLRRTTWRPLAIHTACDAPGDRGASQVRLDGGELRFDAATGGLSRVQPGAAPVPLPARFSSPGSKWEDPELPPTSCGEIRGIAYGFGGPDLGLAILVPEANLGDDYWCFGVPSADAALVLPLR